jgi:hypothetical protein
MSESEKQQTLRDFAKLLEYMKGHGPTSREALNVTRRVEAKSAVLLSHVSLMIAVTGVLWAVAGEGTKSEMLFAVELVAYLVLAIACIAIQRERNPTRVREQSMVPAFQGTPAHHQDYENVAECIWKLRVFRSVQLVLPLLTVVLILTILWFVFWDSIEITLTRLLVFVS